MISHTR